jgi:hypothetical protein
LAPRRRLCSGQPAKAFQQQLAPQAIVSSSTSAYIVSGLGRSTPQGTELRPTASKDDKPTHLHRRHTISNLRQQQGSIAGKADGSVQLCSIEL